MLYTNVKHKQILEFIIFIILLVFELGKNGFVKAGQVNSPTITTTQNSTNGAARNFRIIATELKCTHKVPHLVESLQCQLTKRNNRTYSSGSLLLRQPVSNLQAMAMLDLYQSNGRLMNIFNITADVCKVLAVERHSLKILNNLLKIFFATVNEKPICPLKANFTYTLTDFDVKETLLPAYIPKAKFRSGIHFGTSGQTYVASVVVEGKIISRK